MFVGDKGGIRPIKLLRQVLEIKKIAETGKYDLLHCFGSNRLAHLAGLLKFAGVKIPIVLTIDTDDSFPIPYWFVAKYLWGNIAAVMTSTAFMKRTCEAQGIVAKLVRHGISRDMTEERGWRDRVGQQHRVLFWRDPSEENGADICLEVFRRLAPRFPDVSFDLAVRPHWRPVPGLRNISAEHQNVKLHEFPYEGGTSIARLMKESICILLPFRKLSTHPQLAILESMHCGRAVVTTALGSNNEVIQPGRTGFLVPVGDEGDTANTVERLLLDRKQALRVGEQAAKSLSSNWHWTKYPQELTEVYKTVLG
jgi:glycosyltransferase involved in cell wall biosynthesis